MYSSSPNNTLKTDLQQYSVGFYMFTFLGVTKKCTDFSKVPATPGNGWEPARHNPGVTIQNMRDCTTICSPGDISMYYLCVYR